MKPSYVFCLEALSNTNQNAPSKLLPWLENLAVQFDIPNVYQSCTDIEGLEQALQILLYEDRNFNDYNIIYFHVRGSHNTITLDNYHYDLEEIAELFEGKLKNKIIHFSNAFRLDLDPEQSQYFLDVTGARGLSGYINNPVLPSQVLDAHYFDLCQHYTDVVEITETLCDEHFGLFKNLGFNMYY